MPTPKDFIETPLHKFRIPRSQVLNDYEIAFQSRAVSLLGRREVLTGKAKFGIFGDGKELPQVVMAHAFQAGDLRAGYYRDQTFMFASGMLTVREMFAQLYADVSTSRDPSSGGRLMSCHFGTRFLDDEGGWLSLVDRKNSSSDISPTAAQMPRLLGLAYASKLYRELPELKEMSTKFSRNGNEVAFGTIGNASTSEGHFFEVINAAGVLGLPMAMSVWDDGYGISVPARFQTLKESISDMLSGITGDESGKGYLVYKVVGWDYLALLDAYLSGVERCRRDHIPVLFHITELTQPQGHSTSGSQERYKSAERLAWETDHDCLPRFRQWILSENLASEEELVAIETRAKAFVESEKTAAYAAKIDDLQTEKIRAGEVLRDCASGTECPSPSMEAMRQALSNSSALSRKHITSLLVKGLGHLRNCECGTAKDIRRHYMQYIDENIARFDSHLYSSTSEAALAKQAVPPTYGETPNIADGRSLLLRCFEANFARDPRLFVIGEDVGKLGDVNLVFEGLQEKFGPWRLTDTGIREASIAGQGIGAAMRGLRPIVDIQYLDYIYYAVQTLSDDLATLYYRTSGGQKAPVVVRTKGHRLEGPWHAGSPMGMLINALRGMYICVPRNMTQAAGFYNVAFRSDDPTLVVETLNGYRLKEAIPDNVGEFMLPFGVPEVLREGTDITLVTYGACCPIALGAAQELENLGISIEVIDVQTLLPFDRFGRIGDSVRKTNALIVMDEDGPGGSTAFMLQQILEEQNGYDSLDSRPRTLTAKAHRCAAGTDGDYFSKPNAEDIVLTAYQMMRERTPRHFPALVR